MPFEISEDLVSLAYQSLGYFVLEGRKLARNREIDLLALRLGANGEVQDRLHIEVRINIKPAGVIRPDSGLGRSAKEPAESARGFAEKKFASPVIAEEVAKVFRGRPCRRVLVHGRLKDPSQLGVLREEGIECVFIGDLVRMAVVEGAKNRLHRAVEIAALLTEQD